MRKVKTPGGSSGVIAAEKSVSSLTNISLFQSSLRTAKASSLLAEADTLTRVTALKVISSESTSLVAPFFFGVAPATDWSAGAASAGGAAGVGMGIRSNP